MIRIAIGPLALRIGTLDPREAMISLRRSCFKAFALGDQVFL